jgi:ribonuclease HI
MANRKFLGKHEQRRVHGSSSASAPSHGIKELDVYSDSELLVKQLNGDYAVKAEHLKPLHEEAKALLAVFPQIHVAHIPREENEAADEMSNRAIDERL